MMAAAQPEDNSPPEPYSHPIFKPLIIRTIFLGNGVSRVGGLVDACSVKLGDHNSFNPIPIEMLALAAAAVTYPLVVELYDSERNLAGLLCTEGVGGRGAQCC